MLDFSIASIMYYLFALLSIVGMAITGYLIAKKQNLQKPYIIPEPKYLYVLGVWVVAYIIPVAIEWIGHTTGLWVWVNPLWIFIHSAWWWANAYTVCIFVLTPLKPLLRYLVFLGWVLFFELIQEAFIHYWSYFPLL